MDKIKTRDEQSSKDKWNIEKIYKTIDEFNEDYNKLKKELDKLVKLEDNFLDNSTNFKDFFIQDEKVNRILEKLSVYSNCKSDEDKSNSTYQSLAGKITNLYAEYNEKTANIIPRMLKEDKNKILRYLEEEKELTSHKYPIERILKEKEHTLSEEVEKVISAYSPVLDSSYYTSSYLRNADLKFDNIKDENNKEVELTEANYSIYIRSKDRSVRKDAFNKLYKSYKNLENTLTSTYNTTVTNDSITARLRNYNSSIEMYLKPKNIPITLYDNLIKVVRDNLDTLYEYYDLKKEILNLDEYHLYDSYVSIVKENNKKYSFEEAKELVLNALSVYGDEYTNILKTAFADGWIDIYPNKGKRGGAYSTGSYDTLPYVLLNYTEDYNDVSTLAHELGHSMHTYLNNKANPYITANYPIFLAEIASTTNELLLSHYMYKNSNSKEEKLAILNEKLELFKATIYRQTMFAEFEKIAHEHVDNGNVLTSDYLCDIYYKLNKEYFGDNVVVDEDIKYEWLRIPHFYTPFYVYQYATSLSIACYVYKNIINETPGFKDKYLNFLASGGKNYPLEVLKLIDIDLCDTKVFESALNDFKETLEEFKQVYNSK
ncbi:MAG: oligoendopeptidase F [Firmicutes bacterium]|nr:oligoendopeptidase F [Bacillota bacterium]